jgi:glycosyltransferase involved in cell wall biosynthesis
MKIAIQASDLDSSRIDGTRVYLLNMLRRFGKISPVDEFLICHKSEFNHELTPPEFPNYKIKKIKFPFLWTQIAFAWKIWREKADVLWMPMHNIPFFKRKNLKTVVTIHDMAFKYFPDHFPKKDLRRLNFLTERAIQKSDKIIAVSQSTKNDIVKFYPQIQSEKIKVIYHGLDLELFQKKFSDEEVNEILSKFKIQNSKFILYVGAIQPRKNLKTLIQAFNAIKQEWPSLKLVLAGNRAWMWEKELDEVEKSPFRDYIALAEDLSFYNLAILYRQAKVFVFPSLYEGFGIPVLEAFASGVPVICAKNSSLPEVAGEAAEYFESENVEELSIKIKNVLSDESVGKAMIAKGQEQIKKFSWDKCAEETLKYIKN